MVWNFFSRTYRVECPDGPRTVHKNIDNVFPLHLRYTKTAVEGSVRALKNAQGKVGAAYEQRISAVLAEVDAVNRSMQAQFRAAYAVFEADPCNQMPYLSAAIERIIVDEQRLRVIQTVSAQLNAILNQRPKGAEPDAAAVARIDAQLANVIAALAPPRQRALVEAMERVGPNTAAWRGDDEDA